jgi:hypothetical protein
MVYLWKKIANWGDTNLIKYELDLTKAQVMIDVIANDR